jgi:hypothetical protein
MKLLLLVPFLLTGCVNTTPKNNYGFLPQGEDSVTWEFQSRENLLNSQDGSYKTNSGTKIWQGKF